MHASSVLAAFIHHSWAWPTCSQIAAVRRLFEDGREEPPFTRNMPPVAGSVKWSRGLLVRLRRTWVRLQALGSELEGLEPGRRTAAAMTGKRYGGRLEALHGMALQGWGVCACMCCLRVN